MKFPIVLALALTVNAASAAEIPDRFRGVWVDSASSKKQCRASDWKNYDKRSDAMIRISSSAVDEYEGQCIARTYVTPHPSSEQIQVTFDCTSEGENFVRKESWTVASVRGSKVLTTVDDKDKSIRNYMQCR